MADLTEMRRDLDMAKVELIEIKARNKMLQEQLEKKSLSLKRMTDRVEVEVKTRHDQHMYRFFRNHGLSLDELDISAMNTSFYRCLKEDLRMKSNQKMINITPFGIRSLEVMGIFVNRNGVPREQPQYLKTEKILVKNNFENETVIREEKGQEIAGSINTLITSYFKEPVNCSNRGKKRAKHDFDNYSVETNAGYKKGDRDSFNSIEMNIRKIDDTYRRPHNEVLFKKMKRQMDSIPDRKAGPSPALW